MMVSSHPALMDDHGRTVNDLRISLTSACDLSCWFCHHEGVPPGGARGMSPDEVERVCAAAARLGVRHLKLTGGEPLLRKDIVEVVRRASTHIDSVSLVTNGQRLEHLARPLRAAGLRRVNVSVHTLDPVRYHALTGGELGPVLRGLRAAVEAGLAPVKANVVVTRETAGELPQLLRWAAAEELALQLIEIHEPPSAASRAHELRAPVTPIEEELRRRSERTEASRMHNRRRYHVEGVPVEITRPQENPTFCNACTRLRITAEGALKPCLMRDDNHVELLGPLRAGASDEHVETLFREAARRRAPFWRSTSDA